MDMIINLKDKIVFETDNAGKRIVVKQKGIELPVINEKKTKQNIQNLLDNLYQETSPEEVFKKLMDSVSYVKKWFMGTHNGFRQAAGVSDEEKIYLPDIFAFSTAAAYCFELLPETEKTIDSRVGIGVISPAGQDCGKNLIKLVWKSVCRNVIDIGINVKPKEWIDGICEHNLSVVGVSCMVTGCIDNLEETLKLINEKELDVSLCIGGIASSGQIAQDLSQKFNIPIYYGRDINDAENVLSRAVASKPVEIVDVKSVAKLPLPAANSSDDLAGTDVYKIPISDIAINEGARTGCGACEGDKKKYCPLELGYEKQQKLNESKTFIKDYKYAALVLADMPEDLANRRQNKKIWEQLMSIQQVFEKTSNETMAFRYPITCPWCSLKECKLSEGECMFPAYYMPLHETYNINISDTLNNVFGEKSIGRMCSIILIK